MPKEFIHCRDFGRTYPVMFDGSETPKLVTSETSAVKVGWGKESEHVELAVVEMVDGAFVEHGWEVANADGSTTAQTTPFYIQMDRVGLNRLIKVLRKARDDAYGKDA